MLLFLGGFEQELTCKIDVFQKICVFLLAIASSILPSGIDFSNLLLLRDKIGLRRLPNADMPETIGIYFM